MLTAGLFRNSIKIVFLWAVGASVLQILIRLMGVGYDSQGALPVLLWWATQIVTLPVWCISEGAALAGVEVKGFDSYIVTTGTILALSLIAIVVNLLVSRSGKGVDNR